MHDLLLQSPLVVRIRCLGWLFPCTIFITGLMNLEVRKSSLQFHEYHVLFIDNVKHQTTYGNYKSDSTCNYSKASDLIIHNEK